MRNGGWCRHQPPLSKSDSPGRSRLVSLGRFGSPAEADLKRTSDVQDLLREGSGPAGGFRMPLLRFPRRLAPRSPRRTGVSGRPPVRSAHDPCGCRPSRRALWLGERSSVSGRSFRPRTKPPTRIRVAPSEIDLWISRISGIEFRAGPHPCPASGESRARTGAARRADGEKEAGRSVRSSPQWSFTPEGSSVVYCC